MNEIVTVLPYLLGIVILITIFIGGFAANMQAVTLYVGKKLAPKGSDNLMPTGLQDVITPRIQDKLNTILPISYLAILILGTITRWYMGVILLFATLILITYVKQLFPRNMLFYVKMIFWDMTNREADYARSNDLMRQNAIHDVLVLVEQYLNLLSINNQPIPNIKNSMKMSVGEIDN